MDDISSFEKQIYDTNNQGNIAYYDQFIKPKGEERIKAWLEHQVYLSLGFFLSACASFAIDSTPMEGIDNLKYDDILNIPEFKSLFAVSIGFRDSADTNQPQFTKKNRKENAVLTF